jgi:hypothetical protein
MQVHLDVITHTAIAYLQAMPNRNSNRRWA